MYIASAKHSLNCDVDLLILQQWNQGEVSIIFRINKQAWITILFHTTKETPSRILGSSFINCSTTFWCLLHWSVLWVLFKLRTPMGIRPNCNLLWCAGFVINSIRASGTLKMRQSASPSRSSPRVLRILTIHRCSSKFY